MVAGTVLGGQIWWSGLLFLTSLLLVNLFPFKMHDSQIVGSQKVIMKPVVPYRTADASSFSPDFGTVWRLILHDFGISLESYPVMSWQSFFHGTRETKTTWCSLSLVKKVGRADGYLHLHLLWFFWTNPTRLACWSPRPHIRKLLRTPYWGALSASWIFYMDLLTTCFCFKSLEMHSSRFHDLSFKSPYLFVPPMPPPPRNNEGLIKGLKDHGR